MMRDASGARIVGRYVLHEEFASGGMASVHFGRLLGEAGFTRAVAIKRLHPQHAKDPAFVAMLLDEARLAARIRHPNVALILDVVATEGEVFLVMEYVHGESLAALIRASHAAGGPMPARVVASIVAGVLRGLGAAHAATSETGERLGLVHRDVSPDNVLVGVDGAPRVLDFGVALAAGRSQITREGRLKGKLGYMAPELLEGQKATPLSDVYSAGVVLWEALVGKRLFSGAHEASILAKVLRGDVPRPSGLAPLPLRLDDVILRALSRYPADRYETADDFADALEDCLTPAPQRDVAAWVAEIAANTLATRAARLAEVERAPAAAAPADADAEAETDASDAETVADPTRALRLLEGSPARELPEPGAHTEVMPTPAKDAGSARSAKSKAKPAPPPAERARRRTLLGLALLAIALFAGGITLGSRWSGAPPAASSTSSTSESEPPTAALPSAPAPSAIAIVESAPTATPALPSATPAASSSAAPRAPRAPRLRPACDPPFTVDEKGMHHLKPECMR